MAKNEWNWDKAPLEKKKLFVRILREDGHSDEVIGTFFGKSKGTIVGFRHRELPELTFGKKATKPVVDQERFRQLLEEALARPSAKPEKTQEPKDEPPVVLDTVIEDASIVPVESEEIEPVEEAPQESAGPGCEWPLSSGGSLKNPELCGKRCVPDHRLCEEHLAALPRRRK